MKEFRDEAGPLVKGSIQMGFAIAEGLLRRGTLRLLLEHAAACEDDVLCASFEHVVRALENGDGDLDELLDEIERLVLRARAQQGMH